MRFETRHRTPREAAALLVVAAIATLTSVGCPIPRYPLSAHCTMSVRPTDATGAPLANSVSVPLTLPNGRYFGGGSIIPCTVPYEADADQRWNAGVVALRARLCSSTSSELAWERFQLRCADSAGWCRVPGSSHCVVHGIAAPGCSGPPSSAALPDCPTSGSVAGPTELCFEPSPVSTDLGNVLLRGRTSISFKVRACGSGRMIVPVPTLTPGLASMASFGTMSEPGLVGACMTLTGPEAAAGGAFLGPMDRADCTYTLRFSPESAGPHEATLRLTARNAETGMTEMLVLVFRGNGVP